MKKRIMVGTLLASTLLLAACNGDETKEKEVESEKIVKEEIKTEPNVTEKEEVVDGGAVDYSKKDKEEKMSAKGTIVTVVDEQTILVQTTNGKQVYYKMADEVKNKITDDSTGDSISYTYYQSGENKIMAEATVTKNTKKEPTENTDKNDETNTSTNETDKDKTPTNETESKIETAVFEYQGLMDAHSILVTKGGKEYYPTATESQIQYLEDNVSLGGKITMAYAIDENGSYVAKSIIKKD